MYTQCEVEPLPLEVYAVAQLHSCRGAGVCERVAREGVSQCMSVCKHVYTIDRERVREREREGVCVQCN